MAKKALIILGIVTAAAAAALGGWQFYFKDQFAGTKGNDDYAYVTRVGTITGENLGVQNWYAGVVEAQKTIKINLESGRKVGTVNVEVGSIVKPGDVLFEYDLTSIEDSLKTARLEYDKQVNETINYADQVASNEQQLATAKNDNEFLSYSISLQSARLSLTQSQYKEAEKLAAIEKLEALTGNTQVFCEVEGVVQKIDNTKLTGDSDGGIGDTLDYGFSASDDSSDGSFITILGTGNYRVKGNVNEQNRMDIVFGKPVIIRSRADGTQIWHGTMGNIDERNATQESSDDMYSFGASSDSQTSSTTYPFYVDMEDSTGLMLGQHVYIEPDEGQSTRTDGLWLLEYYIEDVDTEKPYVWAADEKDRLEKRYLTLGEYDEANLEYLILDGLTTSDYICAPDDELVEGMRTMDASTVSEIEEDWESEDWESADWEDTEDWDDSVYDSEFYGFDESFEGDEFVEETDDDGWITEDEWSEDVLVEDGMVSEDGMIIDPEVYNEESGAVVYGSEDTASAG